jgi:hypothetical protein
MWARGNQEQIDQLKLDYTFEFPSAVACSYSSAMWHAISNWLFRLPAYADFWNAFWAAVFGALAGAAAAFELERRRRRAQRIREEIGKCYTLHFLCDAHGVMSWATSGNISLERRETLLGPGTRSGASMEHLNVVRTLTQRFTLSCSMVPARIPMR